MAKTEFVPEIEALRGAAAFIVMAQHCYGYLHILSQVPGAPSVPPSSYDLVDTLANGIAQVFLFFAISGYALATQPHWKSPSLPDGIIFIVRPVAVVASVLATRSEPATALLRISPLRGLGKISYSFYLLHWPVVTFLRATVIDKLAKLPFWFDHPLRLCTLYLGIAFACTLPLATLCYLFVEKPTIRASRNFAKWAERFPGHPAGSSLQDAMPGRHG